MAVVVATGLAALWSSAARAEAVPTPVPQDGRIRVAPYDRDQVYRLRGFVGYQIDLEFAPGERFVGLGAGDVEGLAFAAERNHLFLKPKARSVATNITVLTTKRTYQFRYTAASLTSDTDRSEVVYAVRFRYPRSPQPSDEAARRLDRQLDSGTQGRRPNYDYWFCGDPSLKPVSAWDDGVHTRLRFAAHTDMPAIFLRNDDGSESLLNFSIDHGEVILHRVARRFVLRRGHSTGCIVNEAFHGGGSRLGSGTVAPDVLRVTRGGTDERR